MSAIGTVLRVDIDQEIRGAYLDYAMSVIVSRALPDVRDGLKPVHRRILYAMYDMGLRPDRPYKKSARIVGEVLGKYHPHGDSAVYDAMVRMAQDFAMRYPLVDGQGNFGSVDGDAPAAMRYTEARLAPIALEMLADIEKETVDFTDNFDGTLQEPTVLPSALPNLLVNGASGIAVGMATNIPPHNLGEVCDALCYLIDRYDHIDEVTVEDLMPFIKGPDFPTGGIVYRYRDDGRHDGADTILNAYATGRGHIVVQARTHVEEMSRGRHRIVVTELPYQVNKANLIERIAQLVRDGRLENITDLRDESDRTGMRVVIELSRNANPSQVLEQLFKLTPLRQTFGVIMLALVDGQPRTLTLKSALQHYLEHRITVVRRRSEHELARARRRAHILEGLRVALDHLDEVIQLIRRSRTTETAHKNLKRRFKLSDEQATAILEMPLRRLAALERRKIEEEYKEVLKRIAHLQDLLAHPAKLRAIIRDELQALKRAYADKRRTAIVEAKYTGQVSAEDLIADTPAVLVVSQKGEVERILNLAHKPRSARGLHLVRTAHNRHELLIVTEDGLGWRRPVHQVPQRTGSTTVTLGQWLTAFGRRRAVALLDVPAELIRESKGGEASLVMVSRKGRVMRVAARDLAGVVNEARLFSLDKGDAVVWAGFSPGNDDFLLLFTRAGQAIRFPLADVRPMGPGATGVLGVKLAGKEDEVIGAGLQSEGPFVVVVSQNGYTKLTPVTDFPAQGRYGKGVVAFKANRKSGPPTWAAVVTEDDAVVLHATRRSLLLAARKLPQMGRAAAGLAVLRPEEKVTGASVWRTRPLAATATPPPPDKAEGEEPKPPKKRAATKAAKGASASKRSSKKKSAKPSAPTAKEKPARKRRSTTSVTPPRGRKK